LMFLTLRDNISPTRPDEKYIVSPSSEYFSGRLERNCSSWDLVRQVDLPDLLDLLMMYNSKGLNNLEGQFLWISDCYTHHT